MLDTDFQYERPDAQEPDDCIGDLTLDEVALDKLRQAIFEQAGRAERIPALLSALTATDWVKWLSDAGARVAVCAGCNRYMRVSGAVNLYELPWLGDGLYCTECAERVRAEHTFACEVCGHDFYAQREPQPFKVCPECDSPGVTLALTSLWAQLQRARKLELPATLTPREWLDTLDYFGWRCAYCMRAEFACLDHYVPVVQGGGTTRANCVPACTSCNSAKGGRAPQGYVIKASAYTRVEEYLAQFQ
ncbi:MAG: HNH endonuclease [Chloroflexi bacterium]|nr:HNH endonuclease [Chloroflexota bacterium]